MAEIILLQYIDLIFKSFSVIQDVVEGVTFLGGLSQQLMKRTLAFKGRLNTLYESPKSYLHLTDAVKDLEDTVTDILDFLQKLSETSKWRLLITKGSIIDNYMQLQGRLDRCRDDLQFEIVINQKNENQAFEDDLQDVLKTFLKEQQSEVKQVMVELVQNLVEKNVCASPVMDMAHLVLDPKNADKDPSLVIEDQCAEDIKRLQIDQQRIERIGEKIGSGGFGVIYRGLYNKADVALKCLRQERNLTLDDEETKSLLDEVRLQNKCSFKHVAHMYGYCHADSKIFAVMEYASCGSLGNLLKYATGVGGLLSIPGHEGTVLPVNVAIMLLYETAIGMEFIHSRCIIHRDIKPSNILLDPSLTPKLTDFGLAKDLTDIDMQSHTANIGSFYYMAPEVLEHAQGVSSKTHYSYTADVYSFGAVIVELCHRLYGDRKRQLVPKDIPLPNDFPRSLDELKDRCIARIPNHRFGRGSDEGASLEPELKVILDALGGSPRGTILLNGGQESQLNFYKLCAAAATTGALCSGNVVKEDNKNSMNSARTASTVTATHSHSSSNDYIPSRESALLPHTAKHSPEAVAENLSVIPKSNDVLNIASKTMYDLDLEAQEEEKAIHVSIRKTAGNEVNGYTSSNKTAVEPVQEEQRFALHCIMSKWKIVAMVVLLFVILIVILVFIVGKDNPDTNEVASKNGAVVHINSTYYPNTQPPTEPSTTKTPTEPSPTANPSTEPFPTNPPADAASTGLPNPSFTVSPTDPTTVGSINPSEQTNKCFETTQELRMAVVEYLDGNTTVKSIYGDPIGSWCVDIIEDFSFLFNGEGICIDFYRCDTYFYNPSASAFNEDISRWNTSSATNMFGMFNSASMFNQSIGTWDVSSVTNMSLMFADAVSFNRDISNWNVSSLEQTDKMFRNATSFNQDISGWNITSVNSMLQMFNGASSFNQDLCEWGLRKCDLLSNSSDSNENSEDGVFFGTSCPNTSDPIGVSSLDTATMCHQCNYTLSEMVAAQLVCQRLSLTDMINASNVLAGQMDKIGQNISQIGIISYNYGEIVP